MTLMELTVGIVITGAMAGIGVAAFNTISDHRRTILESSVEVERASALREMLRSWIHGASIQITTGGAQRRVRTFGPGFTSTTTFRSNQQQQQTGVTAAAATGADELSFVTSALTPALTPRTRVRLFVDADPATPEAGLTIEYQSSTAAPLQRMQLDSTIVAMTVEFLDRTTNRWVPYAEAATIQPIATRVSFPAVDGVYVPPLLQYPMLFVFGQTGVQQQQGRGGGR